MEPTTVRCSHILQKSTQSRRPFDSYRNKPVTRSPEEAMENIKKIREEVVSKKSISKKTKTRIFGWQMKKIFFGL